MIRQNELKRYHVKIVDNINNIKLVLSGNYLSRDWQDDYYTLILSTFNSVFNKQLQKSGCGSCRDKIRKSFIAINEYIQTNNL